jgi:phage gp37-like protein
MMMPITAIENAIIERIRAAKLPYLRFVGSYAGELMGDWQDVIRALPAVWVAFQNSDAPRALDVSRTRYQTALTFAVVVAARSVRSEAATRKGAGGDVGSYRMLADVAALLALQDFDLTGVEYLRPGRVRSLFNAAVGKLALSVFSQDYTTIVQYKLREPGQVALGQTPDGYLPPEGQTLPGAANADKPAPQEEMRCIGLRYWLIPQQDMETEPPMSEDTLTLNIQL